MASPGKAKQMKVDNWGIFFLQRLEHLFEKGSFCDWTLHFSSEVEIKVHSLVLNGCTEYFQILEKQGCLKNGKLELPSDLLPEVVIPIIKFMYTGRLELDEDIQSDLYAAANQLRMSVLTKLLDAQGNPPPKMPKNSLRKPAMTYSLQGKRIAPRNYSPTRVGGSPIKRDGLKTTWPEPLPGRKLPIWKRKAIPKQATSILGQPTQSETAWAETRSSQEGSKETEPARPTRFEWPDMELEFPQENTPFSTFTYETEIASQRKSLQLSITPAIMVKGQHEEESPTDKLEVFETLCRTTPVKRVYPSVQVSEEAKRARNVDIEEVREFVEEQRVRGEIVKTDKLDALDEDIDEVGFEDGPDMDDDDDDIETIPIADPIEISPKEDMPVEEYEEDEPAMPSRFTLNDPTPLPTTACGPQKSILRPQKSVEEKVAELNSSSEIITKRVRFLLNSETENASQTVAEADIKETEPSIDCIPKETSPQQLTFVSSDTANRTPTTNNSSPHTKIISEVLKKYPQLMKDNKNIRLKILQKPVGHSLSSSDSLIQMGAKVKSKVQYVVLKSDTSTVGKSLKVMGKRNEIRINQDPLSAIKSSGAENITGPWFCHTCGEEPINFESYYLFRRHLQDVHQEKLDSRICEHCGHRCAKRNLLLYHLYTRHNVQPPRNCQFPKCDQCDYIALSEGLLIKHRNSHLNSNKEFICKECGTAFKSNGALQGHMQANLHSQVSERKEYSCHICDLPFLRNINLKAHLRNIHKLAIPRTQRKTDTVKGCLRGKGMSILKPEIIKQIGKKLNKVTENEGCEEDIDIVDSEDELLQVEPKHMEDISQAVQADTKIEPLRHYDPSSEAEALSNVASGIAASLGLLTESDGTPTTCTVYTATATDGIVVMSTQAYTPGTIVTDGTQEYIIPEIENPDEAAFGTSVVTISGAGNLNIQGLRQYAIPITSEHSSSTSEMGSSTVTVHDMPGPGTYQVEVVQGMPQLQLEDGTIATVDGELMPVLQQECVLVQEVVSTEETLEHQTDRSNSSISEQELIVNETEQDLKVPLEQLPLNMKMEPKASGTLPEENEDQITSQK